ncbi:MAG: sensor histidine kinase [Eubacteriaceae bacterium]
MLFDNLRIPGFKKPLKLYHRIVLFFILAFVFVLTLSFFMIFFFSQQIILNENQGTMIRFNNYVTTTIGENEAEIVRLSPENRLNYISEKIYPYVKDNSLIAYQLLDESGNRYQSSPILRDILSPENLSHYDIDALFNFNTKSGKAPTTDMISVDDFRYHQIEYYYLDSYYLLNDGSLIYIQIIKNLNDSYIFMTILFVIMVTISILGLTAIIIIGIYGTKGSLKPLIEISETAKKITENNLNMRIEETGNGDELDQLIISLNQMIEKLEFAFQSQKQFVSDASHELRIPLTVIQGYADILGSWGKNDPQLMDESIEAIKDEISGMKKTIMDLLFLSRLDNNHFRGIFEKINLTEMIEKIYVECPMLDSNHHYALENSETIYFKGNEGLLIQALRGIIENAQKYTPNDGTIKISSKKIKGLIHLSIEDNGIGIPHEEIDKIRQRFYRIESDRSRETGGTGLGIPIIESIVKIHHGKLIIESEEKVGTKVTIEFKL